MQYRNAKKKIINFHVDDITVLPRKNVETEFCKTL